MREPKWSIRLLLASVVACLAAAVVWGGKQKPGVDPGVYDAFMAGLVSDIYDLEQFFVDQQYEFLPISPPDAHFTLQQPAVPQVLPFTAKSFPADFVKGLVATYENSVPVYPATLYEDPVSRETVFLNADGKEVYALPPAQGYDPYAYLKTLMPLLYAGMYGTDAIDFWWALYDPARVQISVKLISTEDVESYLYAQSAVAQAAETAVLESSGGFVTMSYSGPPVTNICFTAIERTNGIRVTVAYPAGFTNRLDVFNSSELVESWWDLSVTTNVSPSTNWIEWTDTSVTTSWVVVRSYAAGNGNQDTDGDGFTDAREIFMYHTDPNNSTSKPVTVSGSVSYSGIETGTIFVLATVISNGWSVGCSTTISGPGLYTNNEVAAMRSYWFKAFRDVNTNAARDGWEPQGIYSSSSTYVTSNLSGINIAVQDMPSTWGTLNYSGSKTGNVYVVAVTASNSWDTTYSCMIPWIQGQQTETGGTIYLTFPVNYSIPSLPTSNYWMRAFMDSDENGTFSPPEAAGQYSSNSIPVSNRVTGISFTLTADTNAPVVLIVIPADLAERTWLP